eukprot:TRINITY_DN20311_c0_g1_i3.p1 TRINITY_DN20311_c0_g1~~TRINITY_DN20311_c0_g1_i3.p1  ORF type:complete len:231 (-),score=39.50 TRINITY_DN20311_c0_g1_i3:94-786(-)
MCIRDRYTERDVSGAIRAACSALAHCTKLKLVHGNISPSSLRFVNTATGCIMKVCNWEASEWSHGHQLAGGALKGLPQYMAPEMVRGYDYSHGIDVWATGICLYLLLSGVLPFDVSRIDAQAGQFRDLYQKIRSEEVPYPSELCADVSGPAMILLRQMLTRHPQERVSFEEALSHEWLRSPSEESERSEDGLAALHQAHQKLKKRAGLAESPGLMASPGPLVLGAPPALE